MTREKIIEQLNLTIGLIKQDGKDWLDDRDIPILEECIKALSQEPTFDDECQKDMDEAWEQIQKKRKRIPVTLMRDATPEEQKSVNDYIKRISTPTGVKFDDEISRELEIKKLIEQPAKVYIDKTDYQRGYIDGVNQMVKELKAEQKSGKWITGINWKCNNCGFVDSGAHGFNYCPNCGAKMERSDKE